MSTKPSILLGQETCSLFGGGGEGKAAWRDFYHSPPYCAEVKNECSYTSAAPYIRSWRGQEQLYLLLNPRRQHLSPVLTQSLSLTCRYEADWYSPLRNVTLKRRQCGVNCHNNQDSQLFAFCSVEITSRISFYNSLKV
jgi:hypothetical protein